MLKSLPPGVLGLKHGRQILREGFAPDYSDSDSHFIRNLLQTTLDAALSNGAAYADARITRTIVQTFSGFQFNISDAEFMNIGVRANSGSGWGFSSSSIIDMQSAVSTGESAAGQACSGRDKYESLFHSQDYAAVTGEWSTPVEIDPFSVSIEEKLDFMRSWRDLASQYRYNVSAINPAMMFYRQERYFASSTGSFIKQKVTESRGFFPVAVGNGRQIPVKMDTRGLVNSGRGWEMFSQSNLIDQLPEMVEEGVRRLAFKFKPVEIGRFPIILDAVTAASVLDATIGVASQLDRAIGLEANSAGTGYLGPDPYTFLGKQNVASAQIQVKADRSRKNMLSTIGWDDDAVKPADFDIVKDGKLVNYQTTRDTSHVLNEWYTQAGFKQGSMGCSASQSAEHIPIHGSANLELIGVKAGTSLSDMISVMDNGVIIREGYAAFDYQGTSGTLTGTFERIRNGKLSEVWRDAAVLFDSDDWNKIAVTGAERDSDTIAVESAKGEPVQRLKHSVTSVPLLFENMAVIDIRRKG